MTEQIDTAVEDFIVRWEGAGGSERANYQLFMNELTVLLAVEQPHPQAQDARDHAYVYERRVTFRHGDGSESNGYIDCYKRACFVGEAKRLKAAPDTRGFDDAMLRARSQAEQYARALPADEGRPPFLVVFDVGRRIDLYSDFTRSGATYVPFPDPRSHRIALADLRRPDIRDRLRAVWTEPLSLDPAQAAARVTREIAARLAELAKSLERAGHPAQPVAQFLMRCLFTMFAEDVRLLPPNSFRDLLDRYREQPDTAMRMLEQLWRDMDRGGFSPVLAVDVLRFSGKLFRAPDTLPLDRDQIGLLHAAARADWRLVEPAIFGTLLERALDPAERHALGAHFTPRAYVERLVLPTVIEPLRAEWIEAQAAALTVSGESRDAEAVAILRAFHHRLCTVRVLDPACGSGNFLYVTLEHLKRLEGEVLNALDELGASQVSLALDHERADASAGETVDPHQLLGIELNPRAAAIAEVVLWIGYLQWHFRTHGQVNPPQPVIRDFRNIENRDAVLAYDRVEYLSDEGGVPVTRWDGTTYKTSPVTGEQIPDESARIPVEHYVNPRKAEWPEADFVVGNPPFIGNKRMRIALGDGYVEALREVWAAVPDSADFVMYWWESAAQLAREGSISRFGLITTNSLRQAFNRRVLELHLGAKENPLSLTFAIPDHPWVDSVEGAAVRIAMTVGRQAAASGVNQTDGVLLNCEQEVSGDAGEYIVRFRRSDGIINADLSIGSDLTRASRLAANRGLACPGVQLSGQGFVLLPEDLHRFSITARQRVIRPYITGRDITQRPRAQFVIDTFGLAELELRSAYPDLYQHLANTVLPDRLGVSTGSKDVAKYAKEWWLHSKPRPKFRPALSGLDQFIVTSRTAKHRIFVFAEADTLPETKVLIVATGDAAYLSMLSSAVHLLFADCAGGRHGVGNDLTYNHSDCFEKFPFPILSDTQTTTLRTLGEQLDAHRKRQQAAHPALTLTGMYNVLEKLRSGDTLSDKERAIHEQGLVSVLRQLHDEIDAAVLDAYGWSDLLPLLRIAHGNTPPAADQTREDAGRAFDAAVLERLVALNTERAAEEARGLVRWLRPEFQNPQASAAPEQEAMDVAAADEDIAAPVHATKPVPWPKDTLQQVRAVAEAIAASAAGLTLAEIEARFTARGPWKRRLPIVLDTLAAVGRVREHEGRYRAM
ncbi:MAG TPA: class I SAM-dependent DNA methyltransferase [Pseudomonadales bacterium]|nr:class I SAM-dependent DNA methyltransferase [Pseudomonadales bacterium]